jgi:RimJ/RimL family protein N-acetyltransferase
VRVSVNGGLEFVRLTEVPLPAVASLLNDRRLWRHMPLAGHFTEHAAMDWVSAKDSQWDEHDYGPWAILADGEFAGWGGFQHEADGADYALVLAPEHWGRGEAITQAALARGFGELGLEAVTIALPFTRSVGNTLARLGFLPDGEVDHAGIPFRRYRLSREDWLRVSEA